ncbi:ATP-dependent DNA helicase PIF1-like [Neltuma alba]|uniref:ATP-dependent DNA helicase PIF1-like n=1 Tax=Neltuma alba TaxID=207710 RepID=UPI0010A43905|nr:ATP-dependent DNA helicase PIF1-like [Prosopis alba]
MLCICRFRWKTFLWNALASSLRAQSKIVLTVASSGIAATLLPSGRTAHSRFAIPIQVNETSMCFISQGSPLAKLLECTKLIIWDEAPMVQRYCIEAFDRSLKDLMHSNLPFGGKCIIMGGDFRQILPVVPKGSRASVVNACICSSYLWSSCTIFTLTKNMRLTSLGSEEDKKKLEWFSKWLLDVGDGKLGEPNDGTTDIEVPKALLVNDYEDPIEGIVSVIYGDVIANLSNNEYFNDRAILAPTIEMVDKINQYMCSLLPGEAHEFFSSDSVCQASNQSDSFDNLYTTEFLNTISSSGLPPHKLMLKVGSPIMLLRNIDQAEGLCNGTRLRITKLGKTVIEAITLNGSKPNQKVLIHRMDMNPSESKWPFKMKRRQFPITLSFAMTINKSQGQSLRYVGVYLQKPVFTHGQLYVALSRVKCMDGLKIVLPRSASTSEKTTKNVVYKEIFSNL